MCANQVGLSSGAELEMKPTTESMEVCANSHSLKAEGPGPKFALADGRRGSLEIWEGLIPCGWVVQLTEQVKWI